MKNAKRLGLFITALLCLILAGCASTGAKRSQTDIPRDSSRADTAAKRYATEPGKAAIYVVREYAFLGRNTPYSISLDESAQGRLIPGTYFLFPVSPGKHDVSFKGKVDRGTEKIYAVAGGIYYIEIRSRSGPGFAAAPAKILRIDQKRARQLIEAGKRARANPAALNEAIKK